MSANNSRSIVLLTRHCIGIALSVPFNYFQLCMFFLSFPFIFIDSLFFLFVALSFFIFFSFFFLFCCGGISRASARTISRRSTSAADAGPFTLSCMPKATFWTTRRRNASSGRAELICTSSATAWGQRSIGRQLLTLPPSQATFQSRFCRGKQKKKKKKKK